MSLRLGPLILTPEGLLLGCALLVFLQIAYRQLRDDLLVTRTKAAVSLCWVSLCGVVGAAIYGIPGTLAAMKQPELLPVRGVVAFGSFGGYWGVLLGSFLAAAVTRTPALRQADAFIPGILVGGAIARVAGLFHDANPGILVSPTLFNGLQPFRYWAAYDVAIHLLTLLLVVRSVRPPRRTDGLALVTFLLSYGALRLGIESFRQTGTLLVGLTAGQVMSGAQIAAGVVLWLWLTMRKPACVQDTAEPSAGKACRPG